jgi:sn-glycerol 3-phosphate transport system permease protein
MAVQGAHGMERAGVSPALPWRRLLRGARSRPTAREEHGLKRATFGSRRVPLLLLAPQLLILLLFFFIPSFRALAQAFLLQDPFGGHWQFVGFDNFLALLRSAEYRNSIGVSVVFTIATSIATVFFGLLFAFATDRILRGRAAYRGILLLPYAIAPAIAGYVWAFLFNPLVGPFASGLHALGIAWNPTRVGSDAMLLVVAAASWKHLCYDYIFFLAALLAVPHTVIEAAAVDGAGPLRRFFTIVLPMIAPTAFFLLVMNLVYALFETFALIDTVTHGGPAGATDILVYKVFVDGFVNLDMGSSAAQSVFLMIFAIALTIIQFRFIERRVNYDVAQ